MTLWEFVGDLLELKRQNKILKSRNPWPKRNEGGKRLLLLPPATLSIPLDKS